MIQCRIFKNILCIVVIASESLEDKLLSHWSDLVDQATFT
jgi:hypothetical protein